LALQQIPAPERLDSTLVGSSLDTVDAGTLRYKPSIEDSELESRCSLSSLMFKMLWFFVVSLFVLYITQVMFYFLVNETVGVDF